MKIVKSGATWSASEIFTSVNLGFGTYQWQIAGPLDRMDHTVVLGLFPYGPQVGIGQDGTNEIDTEFSFWNDELTNVNADWGVYPPSTSAMHWEDDFLFSLNGGSATTTRLAWTSSGITGTLMSGFQPLGASQSVLRSTSYMPGNVSANIPQQALPLGMNLWCYKAPPSSGQTVEIVIQDFQFVPEGQPIPGPDGGSEGGTDTGDAASGEDAAGDSAPPNAGPDAAGPRDSAASPADSGQTGGDDASFTAFDGSWGGNGAMPAANSGCGCVTAGARSPGLASLVAAAALVVVGGRRRSQSPRRT
jgi:hypothetical protein